MPASTIFLPRSFVKQPFSTTKRKLPPLGHDCQECRPMHPVYDVDATLTLSRNESQRVAPTKLCITVAAEDKGFRLVFFQLSAMLPLQDFCMAYHRCLVKLHSHPTHSSQTSRRSVSHRIAGGAASDQTDPCASHGSVAGKAVGGDGTIVEGMTCLCHTSEDTLPLAPSAAVPGRCHRNAARGAVHRRHKRDGRHAIDGASGQL